MFPDLTRDDVFRLETRRLWLRWPRQADLPAILHLAGEKAVADMTARIPHPLPPSDVEDFVLRTRIANSEGAGLTMAVTPRTKPTALIGVVGIELHPEDGALHLGYWLGRPHWGQGLATEAVQAMVEAFFAYTSHVELMASARVVNPASRRVLEKAGFAHQGSGSMAFPARGGALPVDRFRLDRRACESLSTRNRAGLSGLAQPEEGRASTPWQEAADVRLLAPGPRSEGTA